MSAKRFDVVIVGGGVTGTALLYTLCQYTDIESIALLEKNPRVAMVNSHPLNNAQTSHDGSTETNYTLKHALEVQRSAKLLRSYVERRNSPGLFKKSTRMVLGVGNEEVDGLVSRFAEFRPYYPDIRLIGARELEKIEPMVMKGRNPKQTVGAIVSNEGYAIDYQRLSENFVEDAKASDKEPRIFFDLKVRSVRRENEEYILETNQGQFIAKVVVFAAGSYSLLFAQALGYGKHLGILPVAGSFFSCGKFVNGKVYRPQVPGRTFAELHIDLDVLDEDDSRAGPTTKPMPLMERHHYETFFDFIRLPIFSAWGACVLFVILFVNKLWGYVLKNVIFDIPVIGKMLLLRELRLIIPTLKYKDLKPRRGAGGIRPQIVNLKTMRLEMGESIIRGFNILFCTSPSPGASKCLGNAEVFTEEVVAFLDAHFERGEFERDHGVWKLERMAG